MQRLAAEGIPVLIRPDSGLRTTPRPRWTGGLYDFMRRVLATGTDRRSTANAST
jgi:hypothetical protein